MICHEAEQASLAVRVIQRDVFSTTNDLRRDYLLILVSEVVSDFRTTAQLRGVFTLAAECVAPGGLLVLNTFVARDGLAADQLVRELGERAGRV